VEILDALNVTLNIQIYIQIMIKQISVRIVESGNANKTKINKAADPQLYFYKKLLYNIYIR
jgi:hypothetical protein